MDTDKDNKRAEMLDFHRREFEKILAMRRNDPVRFALTRIGVKWDDLNTEYEKNGCSERFCYLRKDLKAFIRRCTVLTAERLQQFMLEHPDHCYFDGTRERMKHGYNWNYK